MKISYNATAMTAVNCLNKNDRSLSNSTRKLSSGFTINRPKDNPSGFALSRRMRSQLEGLKQAGDNITDGVSIIKTADGALSEVHSMIQRLNELAIQGANGTMSADDRKTLNNEVVKLKEEIDRIADSTEFNGQKLLNGTFDLRGYSNNERVKIATYSGEIPAGNYDFDLSDTDYVFSKEGYIVGKDYGATPVDLGAFPADAIGGEDYTFACKTDDGDPILRLDRSKEVKVYVDGQLQDPGMYDVDYNTGKITVHAQAGDGTTTSSWAGKTVTATYAGIKEAEIKVNRISKAADGTQTTEEISARITAVLDNTLKIEGDDGFSMEMRVYKGFDAQGSYTGTNNTFSKAGVVSAELTGLGNMTLQVGANEGQLIDVQIQSISVESLGLTSMNVLTDYSSLNAIDALTNALQHVSLVRSQLGAYQNRLEATEAVTDTAHENMTAALSNITDTDMAEEYSEYATYQVLSQATTAVLSQANKRPSEVLQILQ